MPRTRQNPRYKLYGIYGRFKLVWLLKGSGEPVSPNLYIIWSEGSRSRRLSTGASSGPAAEKFALGFIQTKDAPAICKRDQMPLAVVWDDYLREQGPNIANTKRPKLSRDRILEYFHNETVAAITPQSIRGYIEYRQNAGLQDSSILRELNDFSAALNHQVTEGRLESAPVFKKPKGNPPKERWLTTQEAAALYNACESDHLRLAIDIALRTGQRAGAILELTWDQVKFDERLIYFNPAGRRQTAKRRAIVPISNQLYSILWWEAARKDRKTDYVIESAWGNIKGGRMLKSFRKARTAASLDEQVTFHTLRHTVASWLAQSGADMYGIRTLLAHSNGNMTERYMHLNPDYLRPLVEVLDKRCAHFARNDLDLTVIDGGKQYA